MIDAHLRKLRQRTTISAEEEQAIRACVSETRQIAGNKTLVHAGEKLSVSLLLLKGWLARVKDLRSGIRQVTELHVPGDFPDLHGLTLKRLDHDVVTLTSCTIAVLPHERLTDLTDKHPRLARVYWLMTNIDAAIHREWSLSLGARNALARTAHLFCELNVRLEVAGLAQGGRYDFPLVQRQLAECLGLTEVHVNRTLQQLRRSGLIEVANRRVAILDPAGLAKVAEFERDYLYVDPIAI